MVLNLVVGMLTARYLGPSNYGVINYAASVVAFLVPVMQLGMCNILVQEIVNSENSEGEILGTAILLSSVSSLLCILGAITFVSIANAGETDTIIVCVLYSAILFCQAFEHIVYWFQAKLLSKYTSIMMFFAYVAVAAYRIILLLNKSSVFWFAASQPLDVLLISIGSFIAYRRLGGEKLKFSAATGKRLLSKGHYYIVSSMMVKVFAQTDKIMLKLMLSSADTGYYSAAITCAGLTSFVFSAIIDSMRPTIFERKKESAEKYEKSLIILYSVVIYLSLAQSAVMTAFASLIIKVLYGVQYAASAGALRIVVWYTTFAYLGAVRNIWILAESQQKHLWKINLCGALANVFLNFFLIPVMGVNGAALASLVTQIFTNVIVGYIIKPIRYNNKLMARSLNPKWFISQLKEQ